MSYELLVISLKWLPPVFFGIVFATAVFLYLSRHRLNVMGYPARDRSVSGGKSLIVGSIMFRFFYAFLLTVSQYYVWSQDKFTQILLNSSLVQTIPISGIFNKICQLPLVNCQKFGYFLFYSYGRFWLNALISVAVAFVFYLFLKSLQKHQARFFEEGEAELGFLSALIVGWPNFVVFLSLVFILVILISIFRRVFLKQFYTTLGWPFILAAFASLVLGSNLIAILGLGVLYI